MRTLPQENLMALRKRWARYVDQREPPDLTVGLLASYTIDPLIPYLGIRLRDMGLLAELAVGPFDQIAQQCLDDRSQLSQAPPDVVVAAPRFEELAARPDEGGDLLFTAKAALAACARWRSCLVFVLPAVPEARPHGAGDAGCVAGTMAVAASVREALRAVVAGKPNTCVADAEEAVRAVGTRRAYRPALNRFARIPYNDEVFDLLAQQVARLLRIRYLGACRVFALDADSLTTGDEVLSGLPALREPLAGLRQGGMRLAVLGGSRDAVSRCQLLGDRLPELVWDPDVRWVADGRPVSEQLACLGTELDVAAGQLGLLTADPELAERVGEEGFCAVLLGPEPGAWQSDMQASGMPDTAASAPIAQRPPTWASVHADPGRSQPPTLSLQEFVAGLRVAITFREIPGDLSAADAELVARAHDFALGGPTPGWATTGLGRSVGCAAPTAYATSRSSRCPARCSGAELRTRFWARSSRAPTATGATPC